MSFSYQRILCLHGVLSSLVMRALAGPVPVLYLIREWTCSDFLILYTADIWGQSKNFVRNFTLTPAILNMIIEMQEKIRKLSASPAYRTLVRRRQRVTFLLTVIGILQFVVYFGAIAWLPGLSGFLWPTGSAVSVIIWLTVLVIVMSVLISAFYIWWTGRFYDPERDRILKELADD